VSAARALAAALVLGAAALLGACRERGASPTSTLTAADTADQVLVRMKTTIEDAGQRKNVVAADTAYMYEPSQTIEMRVLTVDFFDPQGNATATLTAREGTYRMQQRTMEARGDVRVAFTDGRRLTAEVLRYDQAAALVTSDRPFVFERPDATLRGNGFRSDPEFRDFTVEQPTGQQREGGPGMLLPGQR